MATQENTSLDLQDVDRFAKIHQYIERKIRTKIEIARRLNLSSTGLTQWITRFERQYGNMFIVSDKHIDNNEHSKKFYASYEEKIAEGLRLLGQEFSVAREESSVVEIGASPFLIAHMMSYAIGRFLDRRQYVSGTVGETWSYRKMNTKIEFQDAYYFDICMDKLRQGELECMIVWDLNGRKDLIEAQEGLTYYKSSRSLPAVVVFGRSHHLWKKYKNGEVSSYCIDELEKERLFILEEKHQFLADRIPIPDSKNGGEQVVQSNMLSMIGAIRAGLPGSAVMPGLFPILDRYRRDGSLFSLPLVSSEGIPEGVDLLYVIRGKKPALKQNAHDFTPEALIKSAKVVKLGDKALERRHIAQQFIVDFDKILNESLFDKTSWPESLASDQSIRKREQSLVEIFSRINTYVHSYHITTDRVGWTTPSWVYLNIIWNESPHKPDQNLSKIGRFWHNRPVFRGNINYPMTNIARSEDQFELECRLVGNQFISIEGDRLNAIGERTVEGSFIANLYHIEPGGSTIVGVWTGVDDDRQNTLTAPFILSDRQLNDDEFDKMMHIAMLRVMIVSHASYPKSLYHG